MRLNELISGKRGITPDSGLRPEKALGASAGFWLNLQQAWELYYTLHSPAAADILKIKPVAAGR